MTAGRARIQRQSPYSTPIHNEVGEVLAELVVALVVEPLDGRILDGAVHALDLAIIRHDALGASMSLLIPMGSALW
jgi:RNase P/RNase MRP subunit p30